MNRTSERPKWCSLQDLYSDPRFSAQLLRANRPTGEDVRLHKCNFLETGTPLLFTPLPGKRLEVSENEASGILIP
jgi:hypothetical protein